MPFLAPFDEFLRITGFDAGMPGLIRDLGRRLKKPVPSEKTMQTAFRKNTTRSTADRILDVLHASLPEDFDTDELADKLRPWEDLNVGSNGASWYPAVMGLRKYQLKEALPYSRAEKLINDRVKAEYEFLAELKDIEQRPIVGKEDRSLKEQSFIRLLHDHTFVDKSLIENALHTNQSDPGSETVLNRLWQEMRIDFYYNLISALSLDLMQRFRELEIDSGHLDEMVATGPLGTLAPIRDPSGKVTYPFERLLERWKFVFADSPEQPLSWRQLSKAIPHPSDEVVAKLDPSSLEYKDLVEKANETRKTRLREWRGGTSPKREQLEQFVVNLVPEDRDAHYALLVGYIAVAWGRLVDQEMAKNEDAGHYHSMDESLLFRYQRVWDEYRDQAAEIATA